MISIHDQIGSYRVVEELAKGTFGTVYRCEHTILTNRTVAIKVLHTDLLKSPGIRGRFLQEAKFLEMLKHSYILSIIDISIYNDVPYLITEFATNGTLKDRIMGHARRPLPLQDALKILAQVGEALQYAHEQKPRSIVHRDLKPGNILFNARGDALLADFGVATMLTTAGINQGTIIGTAAYMAPEQFKGIASTKSDQYALGCIAYEIFTGRKPFTAPSDDLGIWADMHLNEQPIAPTTRNTKLPLYIEDAILKAMAKQSEDRFANVAAFIQALGADKEKTDVSSGKTIIASPEQLPQPLKNTDAVPLKSTQQWLDEGNNHYRAKHYEEALLAYEQAIQLDPHNFYLYNMKGNVLYRLNKYEEALAAYERVIQMAPKNTNAYNGKGNALLSLKRNEEALVAYEQVIKRDPKYTSAYLGKGGALSNLKRYEDALAAYEKAIELNPDATSAYLGKGGALSNLKRYEDALAAYEKAIELNPDATSAYLGKGNTLSNLTRYNDALAAYDRAIQLDYNLAEAYMRKGDVFKVLDKHIEALSAYEKAIELVPDLAMAYIGKGDVFSNLKLYNDALAVYEKALQFAPDFASAYLKKGFVQCSLKQYKEALITYEQAIQLNSEEAYLYERKGDVLCFLTRYEEALQAYEQAIRLAPDSPAAYNSKALTLWNLGRREEAILAFDQAEKVIQLGLDSTIT